MKKVVLVIVGMVILFPFVPYLIPTPMTFERITTGLSRAGLQVGSMQPITPPGNSAVEHVLVSVNDAQVDIYRYEDEGVIATQLGYQQTDPGQAIVDGMRLAEQLGAAKSANIPSSPARKGMFMLVVTSRDKALRARIIEAFKGV